MGTTSKSEAKLNHLFFVDDLKLFAKNIYTAKQLLDMVTTFSKDINMQFGVEKCAYIYVERSKRKSLGETMNINGIEIKELEEGDTYRYLGQDESIGDAGPINKERVSKEFFKRVKKVWNSQLSATNKSIAHNTFAVPIITPTIGILDWTKKEIDTLDIKTRKIMAMSGSLHIRSDVERLYATRDQGGRGLTRLSDIYTSRTITLVNHNNQKKETNELLNIVCEHEQKNLIRVAMELKHSLDIEDEGLLTKQLSQKVRNKLKEDHLNKWQSKVTHGYSKRVVSENTDLDYSLSNAWLKKSSLSSHMEGYILAIEEQEIVTKATAKRREKDPANRSIMDSKCRLCGKSDETINHILASCEEVSSSLYLTYRHNRMGKVVYDAILKEEE